MNKGYWNDLNAPEFYGTTKIILKQNSTFSLTDTRYRIFAKDFEDFDVTNKIISIHNVDTSTIGNYMINYSVVDSNGNSTTLQVPVIVTDDININPMIERTLYSLPSVDNMTAMGANRGNNHDRQMLGIFVKSNSKVKIRRTTGNTDLLYTMLNNDSQLEKTETITTAWKEISFINDYTPFIKTLYKQTTPIKVEIEWAIDDTGIKELNYYHYKDNESAFFTKWKADTNSYAVIDGTSLTVLVPFSDKDKLVKYWKNNFPTLDKFLEYWDKVTALYDMMLALEYAPDDSDNQNVKTKYFVKANVHGGGAAYYAGDHVGINNASVATFFEGNWGGLHEFGHGYQGSLGKGALDIGEVSNNIFGYYAQTNPNIYPFSNRWLGDIPTIEQKYNDVRLSGKSFMDLDPAGKLYFLINLFNSFEGPITYNKIAKFYRKSINQKVSLLPQDAWTTVIAKEYGVNISEFLNAWRIQISAELKQTLLFDTAKNGFSMKDLVQDTTLLAIVKKDLGLNAYYQLVIGDQLLKYNLTGSTEVNFAIDNYDVLNGKFVTLKNGVQEVAKSQIVNGKAIFSNLPIGVYKLFVPQLIGNYRSDAISNIVILNNSSKLLTINYTSINHINNFDNDIKLQFQGYYFNDAAEITLTNNIANNVENIILNLRYRPTTLFNSGLPANFDYASIQVTDNLGTEKYIKKVGGANEYFAKTNIETFQIPVTIGDKVLVKYHNAQTKLKFISNLNTDYRTIYQIGNDIIGSFTITRLGFIADRLSAQDSYNEYSTRLKQFISTFISILSEEDITNPYKFVDKKEIFVRGYKEFNDVDKALYQDLYNKITN